MGHRFWVPLQFAPVAKTWTNPCHYPPTPLKLHETGGTVTQALQVLQTLQWHQPSKSGRAHAQDPTQAYHSYTHTILGDVEDEVKSPNGPPVKVQQNTALLSVCGLTGTPLRVSLSGPGGKECSFACTA